MAYRFTLEHPALEYELKKLIIREAKHNDWTPEDLSDTEVLFGEASRIALDSLDALQICVALQSHFGVRLNGDRMVRRHMTDVAALAAFVRAERQGA